jgi:hypothetical protein
MTSKFQAALDNFISSDEFTTALIDSTKAGFGGSHYSVELFEDGTFRVLWANQIGNKYQTPGLIMRVPQFSDEDWKDWEDAGEEPYDYDNKLEQEMRDGLAQYELDQEALANVEY